LFYFGPDFLYIGSMIFENFIYRLICGGLEFLYGLVLWFSLRSHNEFFSFFDLDKDKSDAKKPTSSSGENKPS